MEALGGQRSGGVAGAGIVGAMGAESEAREVRRQVIIHLRDQFVGLLDEHDFEDLAQESLAELQRQRQERKEVRHPVAFAKQVARRRARDLLRDSHAIPTDPSDDVFERQAPESVEPDRAIVVRAVLARVIEAAERLPRDQQLVYRSHFFERRKPREALALLGLGRREYYLQLERATLAVQASLSPHSNEAQQRELLAAVIGGSASAAERRRAKRLVRHDPAAAALVRELRELHQGAAALLPAPALEELADPWLLDRLTHAVAWLRERAGGSADPGVEQAAAQLSASGAGRAAGAGTGGLLAHLGLAGGAGKVALACLGTGALTTACVLSGVVPGLDSGSDEPTRGPVERPRAVRSAPPPNPDLIQRVESDASAPREPREAAKPPTPREEPASEPASPAVSPSAPPTEQEFGVASAAPAPDPAAAPGGAASPQDVQQEFGP